MVPDPVDAVQDSATFAFPAVAVSAVGAAGMAKTGEGLGEGLNEGLGEGLNEGLGEGLDEGLGLLAGSRSGELGDSGSLGFNEHPEIKGRIIATNKSE